MAIRDMTSPETDVFVSLIKVSNKMLAAGLPRRFVFDAFRLGTETEGGFDLMMQWAEEESDEELKAEIVSDIQDLIDEGGSPVGVRIYESGASIRIDDLDAIAKDIVRFKSHLRRLVDQAGGVTWLAGVTGIPQSSLSRFFSSGAMPRRSTLLRIADAVGAEFVSVPGYAKS
jgi:DNA-binding phage protein